MENELKYSGKLPLLAYAPQNFGHNAQRSRAYRARAAMGRTGVHSPHRATVPSAPVAATSLPLKPAEATRGGATQPLNVTERNVFRTLWLAICSGFRRKDKTVNAADTAAALPHSEQHEQAIVHPHVLHSHAVKPSLMDEPENSGERASLVQQLESQLVIPAPVSQAYAALRVNSEPILSAQNQRTTKSQAHSANAEPSQRMLKTAAISQAPDLAHALEEVRAVLREHERLAAEKQRTQH